MAEYATWDILRHFIALSEEQVAELDDNIDYAYNGITLEHTLHSIFDEFGWSLRPDVSCYLIALVGILIGYNTSLIITTGTTSNILLAILR